MIYFDDLSVGQVFEAGPVTVTREDIIRFAREFDPQPFHLNDEGGRASPFGGVIASGWHTASLAHRMLVDGFLSQAASVGSPGLDQLRWRLPVRPGDTLRLRATLIELRPSRSRPDRGTLRASYEVLNQRDEVVMTMEGLGMLARRPAS